MSKRYGVLIVAGLAAWLLLSGKSRAAEPPDVTDYIPPENPDADNWDLLPNDWYMNPQSTIAERNRAAFLAMIRHAEGTDLRPDPYSVLYSYASHSVDFRDHPAARETYGDNRWRGVRLPDAMCRSAGFGPGCVSTAAGAYQFILGTWRNAKNALQLRDFSPASQDRAAIWLLQQRGALAHIDAGRIEEAISAARREWASLPGSGWGQPERKLEALVQVYADAGGSIA
jgi:lysozyme